MDQDLKKLFIAVPIPMEVQKKIFEKIQLSDDERSKIAFCTAENMHATVVYIGEGSLIDTTNALRQFSFPKPIKASLESFSNRDEATLRVLMKKNEEMNKLCHIVRELVQREKEDFSGHVYLFLLFLNTI